MSLADVRCGPSKGDVVVVTGRETREVEVVAPRSRMRLKSLLKSIHHSDLFAKFHLLFATHLSTLR